MVKKANINSTMQEQSVCPHFTTETSYFPTIKRNSSKSDRGLSVCPDNNRDMDHIKETY